MMFSIQKRGRYWAVYDGTMLVCLTLYKKGALEVIRRLAEIKEERDKV